MTVRFWTDAFASEQRVFWCGITLLRNQSFSYSHYGLPFALTDAMETLAMPDVPNIPLSAPRLLVADDQPHILTALELLLDGQGYETHFASSPAGVIDALRKQTFDTVLLDLNYTRDTTGGGEGLDLVTQIRS